MEVVSMIQLDDMVKIPYNNKWSVELFKICENHCPVKNFISNIENNKLKAKIVRAIDLLQLLGDQLREPECKYISDGIFELRVRQGSNHVRIMYFFASNKRIILTNGFIKKSNKTPKGEIEKALYYKRLFNERKL